MARILVIDDDQAIRLTLGEILQAEGHEVSFAPDGEVGLQFYRKSPFDVVLVDLAMPVKNGLRTIKELHDEYHNARIIAITGADPENLPLAQEYGARATLTKPIDNEDMIKKIDQLLRRSVGWEDVL